MQANETAVPWETTLFNSSTTTWWWSMLGMNATHLVILLTTLAYRPPRDSHERALKLLAVTYWVGCAWRCTFPVLWEVRPHGCLFYVDKGGLIGGELLDQGMSQCAESSIAILFAIKVGRALRANGSPIGAYFACKAWWLIVFCARFFCWYGCSTDNKLWHVFEESSWTAFAIILAIAMVHSLLTTSLPKAASTVLENSPRSVRAFLGQPEAKAVTPKASAATAVTPAGDNSAVGFMLCALPVALIYINFMVTTDVPMYYNAWIDDTNKGVAYPTFLEGMADLVQCEVVETAFEPWREAIVWQTGYFGVMPLMAVASLAHKISEPVEAVEAVVKGKGPRRSSRLKAH